MTEVNKNISTWNKLPGDISTAGEEDLYVLTGVTAGETVYIYMSGGVSYYFDPLLQVLDSDGQQVAENDDGDLGTYNNAGTATAEETFSDYNSFVSFEYQPGMVIKAAENGAAPTGNYILYTSKGTLVAKSADDTSNPEDVNAAPTGEVTIDGTVTEDQTLTANTDTIADADGLGSFSYQWQRNSRDGFVDIDGATAQTYTLGDADVGQGVRVVVSWTDGNSTTEELTSAATANVANINDAPTGEVTIDGTVTEDQTLTANTDTIADADGLGSFSYQWQRNSRDGFVDIDGATAQTYTLGDADVGQGVRVVVSWTDGNSTTEELTSAATANVANINDAPTGEVTIDGTVTEDQTLTANTDAIADADGLGSFSYQWQRNSRDGFVDIDGATAQTYTLGDADVGQGVRVVVSWTDGNSTTEELTSAATANVANINDAPTGEVTIDGTVTEGQTLTANTDTIADADGISRPFSYQWYRGSDENGFSDIDGATGQTYTLTSDDVGSSVQVRIRWADNESHLELMSSTTTPAVAPATTEPSIDDTGPAAQPDGEEAVSPTTTTSSTPSSTPSTSTSDIPKTGDKEIPVTLTEDLVRTDHVFTVSDFPFYDKDPTSDFTTLTIKSVPTTGSLNYNGSAVTVDQVITVADLTNGLLVYTPPAGNDTATASFTFQLSDGTHTTDIASLTIVMPQLGTNGIDNIDGTAGNDEIRGLDGDDEIRGEAGNDRIDGGSGDDTIGGGEGNDTIVGNDGSDQINGGSGNDVLGGQGGDDNITGDYGDDIISGHDGNDVLSGGSGNDTLKGGDGNDDVSGSYGNDVIDGGSGNDGLYGGWGNDIVQGGDGNDDINGGTGDDTLAGGSGNDAFYYRKGDGNDRIIGGDGADALLFIGITPDEVAFSDGNLIIGTGEDQSTITLGADKGGLESIEFDDTADNVVWNAGNNWGQTEAVVETASIVPQIATTSVAPPPVDNTPPQSDGSSTTGGSSTTTTSSTPSSTPSTSTSDIPTTGDKEIPVTLTEDLVRTDHVFTVSDFPFYDKDPTSDFTTLTIKSVPTTGSLNYNGSAVTVDQVITVADLTNGLLVYTPPAGNDTATASFTFQLSDGTHTTDIASLTIVMPQLATNGIDNIDGTAGNDEIRGLDGDDEIRGEAGNDRIDGGSGDDTINGGEGNDTIVGNDGSDQINGGSGNDVLGGQGGDDNITGDYGDDIISGHDGNDVLSGGSGNDTLKGGDGNDDVSGSYGNDVIDGGSGNDGLYGGWGKDIVQGGDGNDDIDGGTGDDTLAGGSGNDAFYYRKGDGNDRIIGGDGADALLFNGITPDEVAFSDGNLIIGTGEDQSTITLGADKGGLESIEFDDTADNVVWNAGNNWGQTEAVVETASIVPQIATTSVAPPPVDNTPPQSDGSSTTGGSSTTTTSSTPSSTPSTSTSDIPTTGDKEIPVTLTEDLVRTDHVFTVSDFPFYDKDPTSDFTTLTIKSVPTTGSLNYNGSAVTVDQVITVADLTNGLLVYTPPVGNDTATASFTFQLSDGTHTTDIASLTIVMPQLGTNGIDNIDGTAGNDEIRGLDGDDEIRGEAGNDRIDGGSGDDTIGGGEGNDTIVGNDGSDQINGGSGNDVLGGQGGDDNITGDYGDDIISGHDGNDVLSGGSGNDTLKGGDGNDDVSGSYGDDVIDGGSGNDGLYGGWGNDIVQGGDGNDDIDGGTGDDTLAGGSGNDAFYYRKGDGNDRIIGGDGADALLFIGITPDEVAFSDGNLIIGTGEDQSTITLGADKGGLESIEFDDTADNVVWNAGNNWGQTEAVVETASIVPQIATTSVAPPPVDNTPPQSDGSSTTGGSSTTTTSSTPSSTPSTSTDQTFTGQSGGDTVTTGAGNDVLDGKEGNDKLSGGAGSDKLLGGVGNDQLDGGEGDDTLDGGAGNDDLRGGDGSDTLKGGTGDDALWAGATSDAKDKLDGGEGNDRMGAGAGDDVLSGGSGNDTLYASSGDDTVTGGTGDDVLWSGAGNDVVSGGAGKDSFHFGNQSGADTVTDFNVQDDTLALYTKGAFTSLADIEAASSLETRAGKSGVLIDFGNDNSLFLTDLKISDLATLDLTLF